MQNTLVCSTLLFAGVLTPTYLEAQKQNQRTSTPNVVFILADDLGYGDLSCYGQEKFETPNIDRLALNGMRFTQCYSGTTVSAPSRSALITGLHTGHTFVRGNKEIKPEGQFPLPADTRTIFQLFQEAGYTTGAFGKWGLGGIGTSGEPNNMGIDNFYGYNCQLLAHNYYPDHLWENKQRIELDGNKNKG
ncbi:MAG: sulfatase-like hydrolase/transferase, partial [Bacteroidales bacterium]